MYDVESKSKMNLLLTSQYFRTWRHHSSVLAFFQCMLQITFHHTVQTNREKRILLLTCWNISCIAFDRYIRKIKNRER